MAIITEPCYNGIMKTIKLTKGYFAIVDDDDFERLSQWEWYALVAKNGRVYAVRVQYASAPAKPRTILMHREILNAPPGIDVDHEDRDGLNNQRLNLRIATRTQNQGNSSRRKDNTSGVKGVTWNKQHQQWRAQIQVNGKKQHLGYFRNTHSAASAYINAAKKHFGQFARAA
jgi:hypothetical protein